MSDHDELTRRAEELAAGLAGASRMEAERRAVASGVHLRFAPEGGVVTTEYVFGRVTAWLRDDVVVQATVG